MLFESEDGIRHSSVEDLRGSELPRALIVDDEPDIGDLVAEGLGSLGFSCHATTSVDSFLELLDDGVAILVLDLIMPGKDGIELLRVLGERKSRADIVLMSGVDKRVLATAEQLASEHGLNVIGCLQKPFRLRELKVMLADRSVDHAEQVAGAKKTCRTVDKADLANAIADNQLVMHYQPQVRIADDMVSGVEALVRWNHPHYGLLFPDAFIDLADSSGLMESLTEKVIDFSLEQWRTLMEAYNNPDLSVSINISASHLNDLSLPDMVEHKASSFGVAPQNVILEITETGLINDWTQSLDIFTRLRVKGIRMSIDDFGTGYSTLAQMKRVPATEIKIDRAFVKDMLKDDGAQTVVRKTVELGHELGMEVVAEGVESIGELRMLKGFGCDVVQGYFFSRPLPLDAATKWLGEWQASHPAQ